MYDFQFFYFCFVFALFLWLSSYSVYIAILLFRFAILQCIFFPVTESKVTKTTKATTFNGKFLHIIDNAKINLNKTAFGNYKIMWSKRIQKNTKLRIRTTKPTKVSIGDFLFEWYCLRQSCAYFNCHGITFQNQFFGKEFFNADVSICQATWAMSSALKAVIRQIYSKYFVLNTPFQVQNMSILHN